MKIVGTTKLDVWFQPIPHGDKILKAEDKLEEIFNAVKEIPIIRRIERVDIIHPKVLRVRTESINDVLMDVVYEGWRSGFVDYKLVIDRKTPVIRGKITDGYEIKRKKKIVEEMKLPTQIDLEKRLNKKSDEILKGIANFATSEFGKEGLYCDLKCGRSLPVAKALAEAGVKYITAWDSKSIVGLLDKSVHWDNSVIEIKAQDFKEGYLGEKEIDVMIIPYTFNQKEAVEILNAQRPKMGAIVYRAEYPGGIISRRTKYKVTGVDEHLLLKPK